MFVTYSPKGDPAQQWEYSSDQVRANEAELIEKRFGDTFDLFNMQLIKGSARARRVLLWHLLKREHLELRLDDLDFAIGELKVEFSRGELQQMIEETRTSKSVPDGDRELMVTVLTAQLESAQDGGAQGKALSKKRG